MLPGRLRLLHVGARQRDGLWLAKALAADSAAQVQLDIAHGGADAATRLRGEVYDAVLITHEPPSLDALDFVAALRAGGAEEALLVLGESSEQELAPLAFETGADAYLRIAATTTRGLLWVLARAIERHRLIRENQRMRQAERQRNDVDQRESQRLLVHQRRLISDLETLHSLADDCPEDEANAGSPDCDSAPTKTRASHSAETTARGARSRLPAPLLEHYRELLRAHVMMGAGNLAGEMSSLADLLAGSAITAQQVLELHLEAVETLVDGLGRRSSRHVLSRADLLVLEVLMHLSEAYRRRYHERRAPADPQPSTGFQAVA
jgi:CheY-like chemotaxis protein